MSKISVYNTKRVQDSFLRWGAAPELTSEAAALLDEHERKIRSREIGLRARKDLLYEARYYGETSSARPYTGCPRCLAFD